MKKRQDEINKDRQENQGLLFEEIRGMIKETIERMLNQELTEFIKEQRQGSGDSETDKPAMRNGYYKRNLLTSLANLKGLQVPRDRSGNFQSVLFEPYQRRTSDIDDLVIELYRRGVSTRDVSTIFDRLYGVRYSAQTVSNITQVVLDDVERWHKRSLKRRYDVLYIDALFIKLRRRKVESEAIYFIVGVDEEGYREVLDYWVGGQESAEIWKENLLELKHRGVEEVLLVVRDNLPGLDEAVTEVFPKADQQHCMVHQLRNVRKKVSVRDRGELMGDLRVVYQAVDKANAEKAWGGFREKWGRAYPKIIKSFEENWERLFTYFSYPFAVRSVIYTTNWIERSNKEFRKRVYPINSFGTEDAVEKLVYLRAKDQNERWGKRKLKGFNQARNELDNMHRERYLGEGGRNKGR